MNRNVIVYISDIDRTVLSDALIKHGVTHISATPTFYRSALAYLKHKVPSVRRVMFGGERFDDNLARQLLDVFVNAKTKNIYASTEAGSMLSSTGKTFVIPDSLHREIKVSPYDGELLIRREVLAGFSGQGEASSEGEWYPTGDLVRYVSEKEFEFIGRKTEMINVGGYKVNPHEVEEEIRKISGVKDALITSKQNALVGQMLIAEILKEDAASEAAIEKSVTRELPMQAWKIPRIVNFVDEIKISRTGKLVR
jgi:acyl-CoA synthetase (AMP-forming)/AMP-acid ligase II